MPQSKSAATATGSLILIALLVGGAAAAFAYTAGWFSPGRLTANRMVDAFTSPSGPPLGHRRNHAKGICFTGVFDSNGAGTELSRAQVFAPGEYPALGRLNLATTDPNAADPSARVRGMGLQISAPNGEEWRTAMIDAPVFAVSTPQAFYQLLLASKSKAPNAMPTFAAEHPEFAAFAAWAKTGPWTGSYAEERFNSLNSFIFEIPREPRTRCAGRSCPQRNPCPCRPKNSPREARISSSRRSPSGCNAARYAGRSS